MYFDPTLTDAGDGAAAGEDVGCTILVERLVDLLELAKRKRKRRAVLPWHRCCVTLGGRSELGRESICIFEFTELRIHIHTYMYIRT